MTKTTFLMILIATVLSSCQNNKEAKNTAQSIKDSNQVYPRFARGYSVEYFDNFKVITVRNPWDTTKILHQYILSHRGNARPDTLPQATFVLTPVTRIVTVFAPHVELVQGLGKLSTIVGVCEPQYIHNPIIKQNILEKKVVDLGPSFNIDIEKVIAIQPDLILVSPFQDNKYGKIAELGIPIAEASCYMEHTPLGRTEWFLFVSLFYEQEIAAKRMFDSIAMQYEQIKQSVIAAKMQKPTIFSEKKFGDIWHIPGGNSYMANLFSDAGASYLWSDDNSTGSLPLNFEKVFAKAANADFWCIKDFADSTYSQKQLAEEFPPYADFKAFKNKHIIFCNTQTTAYYETGFLKPNIVLEDLVTQLHPQLLPNHRSTYFQILK